MDKRTAGQYKVKRAGEVVILDPEGRELARGIAKPEDVGKLLDGAMAKYEPPVIWCESLVEAKDKAKRDKKRIVVLTEDKDRAKAVESKGLKELRAKFIWARMPFDKKSDEIKELGAEKAGQFFVFEERVLATSEAKTEAEIKTLLEEQSK